MITEFLSRGSLDSVLANSKVELPKITRANMLIDAAQGMEFIHSKGKIHRDLKSLNMLVCKQALVG